MLFEQFLICTDIGPNPTSIVYLMVTQRLKYTPHVTLPKRSLLQSDPRGPHSKHSRAKANDNEKKKKSLPQSTTTDTTFAHGFKKPPTQAYLGVRHAFPPHKRGAPLGFYSRLLCSIASHADVVRGSPRVPAPLASAETKSHFRSLIRTNKRQFSNFG